MKSVITIFETMYDALPEAAKNDSSYNFIVSLDLYEAYKKQTGLTVFKGHNVVCAK